MGASQDNNIWDFLLDVSGLPAEIDGPGDLANLKQNGVTAARMSPAAQRAKLKRARLAADLEIEVFLSVVGQPVGSMM